MDLLAIWNEYQTSLKSFLHSKVSNPADVDDLLQEILVKTQNNINNINSQASIKPWLFQTANNTIIDFYRRQAKQKGLSQQELWYGDDEKSVRNSLLKCIVPFIEALPEEDKELLMRVDINGESQKAIAESQGISYSTLKSRVQKSRAKLKAVFEGCCHFTQNRHGELIDYERKLPGKDNC